jgi:hypothetical protein
VRVHVKQIVQLWSTTTMFYFPFPLSLPFSLALAFFHSVIRGALTTDNNVSSSHSVLYSSSCYPPLHLSSFPLSLRSLGTFETRKATHDPYLMHRVAEPCAVGEQLRCPPRLRSGRQCCRVCLCSAGGLPTLPLRLSGRRPTGAAVLPVVATALSRSAFFPTEAADCAVVVVAACSGWHWAMEAAA